MIIKALCDYYDRKAALPDSGIAPPGWEWKEVPFVVVIDRDGNLVQIDDTREGEGKKKRGKRYLVPQWGKRTVGISANLLCDMASYVFGATATGKPERLAAQRQAFVERHQNVLKSIPEAQPFLRFLSNPDSSVLKSQPCWQEILDTNPNISFRYVGDMEMLAEIPAIKSAVGTQSDGGVVSSGRCMVTGLVGPISRLHPSIKGVRNAQSSGASLVAFNSGVYESYGKTQGLVAPIGEEAVFKYTTALNMLLSRDGGHNMLVGDATSVFWSFEKTTFEDDFASLFSEPPKDEPDRGTLAVARLLASPTTGWYVEEENDKLFCYLSLSPNAARISIRDWQVGRISDFASQIRRHFEDFEILKPPREPIHYSNYRILANVAPQDDYGNSPPALGGELMRAILTGGPYPATLIQAALRRIRSDVKRRVTPVRAALIKAWLNRNLRFNPNPNFKEIFMDLDTSQPSIGYQLGRLFAVLERVQERSSGGSLNSTIRERFYGAACATPVTVFANLLRLKNHHLAKMSSKGEVVYFERLLGEIMGHVSDFPSHLALQEQGRFAIGYYHQRQAFFAGKTVEPESDATQD